MATGNYILCDLNYGPQDYKLIMTGRSQLLNKRKHIGMVKIEDGIRLIRKGAIDKWLSKTTQTYDQEHEESIKLAGWDVITSPSLRGIRLIHPC